MSYDLGNLPKCPNCDKGVLFPIEDTPYQNATFTIIKGCFCTNAKCGYNQMFVIGDPNGRLISFNEIQVVEAKGEEKL